MKKLGTATGRLFVGIAVTLSAAGCLPKATVNQPTSPPPAADGGGGVGGGAGAGGGHREVGNTLPNPTPKPTPKSFQGVGF